jgi:signal transduction histidine kinase
MTSRRPLLQSTSLLLVIGFSALFGIVGTTLWLGVRAQAYFNEVIEARDTRAAAVELRNAVLGAESSQRGYLYTGNEIYLAPYDSAKALAQRQLTQLERHLADYPDLKAPMARLAVLLRDKFEDMDRAIALKVELKDAEALRLFRTNRSKALMDEANVFFGGVIGSVDDRLALAIGEQRTNATLLRLTTVIGFIVIVLVVAAVAIAVARYSREITAAKDEVSLLNQNLERRVSERTSELEQANQDIRHFAHVVTHDLRAPLVSIAGFTSELEESASVLRAAISRPDSAVAPEARDILAVEVPEAIGYIRSATGKMNGLIDAISRVSREGRRTLRIEDVDLAELVAASAGAIQHQLSEADGRIETDLNVRRVATDRLSMEQIVGNLLDNAVKYRVTTRALRIVVRSRREPDGSIVLEVEDNGRGIAQADVERVFQLFARSGSQDRPGDGVGLSHVRAVVRNLGGEIGVSSTLEKGSTFRVTLPAGMARA